MLEFKFIKPGDFLYVVYYDNFRNKYRIKKVKVLTSEELSKDMNISFKLNGELNSMLINKEVGQKWRWTTEKGMWITTSEDYAKKVFGMEMENIVSSLKMQIYTIINQVVEVSNELVSPEIEEE